MNQPITRQRPGFWYHHWLLPIVVLALGWLICAWCFRPSAPRGNSAPPHEFSAVRAQQALGGAFGDEKPHPVGSANNAAVRARLLHQLREMGLQPQVQKAFSCRGSSICATVHNIVVVLKGSVEQSDALLLCAHYDSVAAGPGIGDDAVGVAAAIETVRAIQAGRPLEHDLVLLLDDGEEAGLLGAKAFMEKHPLAKRVRAAVNLEARGSSGPSLMFESAGQSDALMDVLSQLERPFTSSLFVDVYKRMPNDTNFTVFQEHGLSGVNLAYIRGLAHYHTPLDNLANNSASSLQHHGDNALALVRALDRHDLRAFNKTAGPQRVWFDWLGKTIVHTTVNNARAMAVGLFVAMLSMVAVWGWRPERRWSSLLKTLLGFGVVLALPAIGLAVVVEGAKVFKGTLMPWSGHMTPYLLALLAVSTAGLVAVGRWLRNARGWLVYAAVWALWAFFGVLLAEFLPAASHLMLVPVVVAVIAGAIAIFTRREERTPWGRFLLMLPIVFAVTVWGRVTIALVHVGGLFLHPAVALVFALPLTALLPALASQPPPRSRRLLLRAVGVAVGAWLITLAVPAFSEDKPQRLSIVFYQPENGASRWLVDATWGEIPSSLVKAGSLEAAQPPPLPAMGTRAVALGAAPHSKALPPKIKLLNVVSGKGHATVNLRVTSPRKSRVMMLILPNKVGLVAAKVDNHSLGWRPLRHSPLWPSHRAIVYLSAPAGGLDVQLKVRRDMPFAVEVLDIDNGLPPEATPLIEARGTRAVPSQDGDLSIFSAKLSLAPEQL